ncbi:MAG: class I SAM-dependent methyltransferase [Candidatus Lokiarchaeota archaeon]|nr:class I SAM-dependent methyltransferase [Candidatus Lokiarchaeota archaeon]
MNDIWNKEELWKSKKFSYAKAYKNIFLEFDFNASINILEIGVNKTAGMYLYKQIFPNSNICGIDINPNTPHSEVGRVWIGNEIDGKLLDTISEEEGPFDLIVDDGSHLQDHQIIIFEHMFPLLNPGGIYVCEDVHTSYHERYQNEDKFFGRKPLNETVDNESFIDYSKRLVDLINFNAWGKGYQNPRTYEWVTNATDLKKYNSYNIDEKIYKSINFISFYPSIVAFHKSNYDNEFQHVKN